MEDRKRKKVCIGLSGGVDSSVAALLLKEQGYDVFAMFMQNWHEADATLHGDCEWEEDRFVAEMVARKIGIPFYFVDLSKEYRKRVVDYMFDEYARGRTPNPDVLCNREIKFDAFLRIAEKYGADLVATGHYCRKEPVLDASGLAVLGADGTPLYRILEGADPNKDQTYFLCQLTQAQLAKALFPIGDIRKPEVRRLAKEADLPSAEKKDSQGICFVGKVDLPTFLKQKLTSVEGDVVEVYDAYYQENPHYQEQVSLLSSLARPDVELQLIAPYAPEEKVLTSDGKPLGESPYDLEKVAALSDAALEMLAGPVSYDIRFETETYRSGKKHIKKTRYKENPFGKIIGRHEGAQRNTLDPGRPCHGPRRHPTLPCPHPLPPAPPGRDAPPAGERPLPPLRPGPARGHRRPVRRLVRRRRDARQRPDRPLGRTGAAGCILLLRRLGICTDLPIFA